MNDDDAIADHLAAALEQRASGGAIDLAAICGDRQDLVPAVAELLGMRDQLPRLQAAERTGQSQCGRVLVGRYRLLEEIGRGAVGAVHRGHDLRLARDVAVKLLHTGAFGSAAAMQRFQREAEVLAQHEHPHIVRVHDQGTAEDGAPFLVTELLRGCSLHAVLEASIAAMPAGPSATAFARADWLPSLLPEAALEPSYLRQVVHWIVQLADGLGAAHGCGVFHRDVKPSNVFVRDDGAAVLLDFGIAVRAGDPQTTLPHTIVGTPCYMAPEQATGRREPSAAVDVYGLAATLYHLVTLQPPHAGDLQTVLYEVRTRDPVPAIRRHPGLPRDLQAVLDHGLERDPASRYPSVAALAADLRAFLDHRPVSVRPIGALGRTLRACRRRPARTAAWSLGTVAVALVLLVLPLWFATAAEAAEDERRNLLARLPGDLCIEGQPDERLLVPLAERQVVLGELDRLLQLDPGDLMVRMLRAAERLDAGEAGPASEDFTALAAAAGSPYLRAVAERYSAAAQAGGGTRTVDLHDLPPVETTPDAFVAGFHAMRVFDFENAFALLTRCADFVPARDLRLLASCGRKQPEPEVLLTEAGWLEGHYGRRTARTRHAMAVAMLLLRRYDQAVAYAEDSLALRPDRHGPWNNLALAHLRNGNTEAARRCYERAVAIRPWFANSLGGLGQTLRALGDFEGAAHTIARIRDVGWREHELGNLAVARSVQAAADGDQAGRQNLAAAAIEHFHAAAAVPAGATRNPRQRSLPVAIAHAEALADPAPATATAAFLRQLRSDPQNAHQLANLAGLLQNHSIDDSCRDELRLFLLELAVHLAPGDARLRADRDALRSAHPNLLR